MFEQPDFNTTELELICSFLQSDELNMSELEAFRAVMRSLTLHIFYNFEICYSLHIDGQKPNAELKISTKVLKTSELLLRVRLI